MRTATLATLTMLTTLATLAASAAASADTYSVFNLGSDFSRNLSGIDDSGNVAIIQHCPTEDCYGIYSSGILTGQTTDISQFHHTKGSLPSATELLVPGGSLVMVNAKGDLAWVDARLEVIMEAIDLTSRSQVQVASLGSSTIASRQNPEPSTFILLGTGLLGVAGLMRKKFGVVA